MIKVITNGKEKIYFTRCVKCATDFEYEFSDVEIVPPVGDYGFGERNIICPICGEKNYAGLLTKDEFEKNIPYQVLPWNGCAK